MGAPTHRGILDHIKVFDCEEKGACGTVVEGTTVGYENGIQSPACATRSPCESGTGFEPPDCAVVPRLGNTRDIGPVPEVEITTPGVRTCFVSNHIKDLNKVHLTPLSSFRSGLRGPRALPLSKVQIPPGAIVRDDLPAAPVGSVPPTRHQCSQVRPPRKDLGFANTAKAGIRTLGPARTTDVTRLDARDDARDEERRARDLH